MISLMGITLVNAQENLGNEEGFDLFTWLGRNLGLQQFSIVGDFRQCDAFPTETIYVDNGANSLVQASAYCSSGFGLIDVFDGNWNALGEFRNNINFNCVDSDDCIAEVYCCDHDECSTNAQCSNWYGSGSSCVTRNADDPNIDYQDSTFNYCTLPSGQQITCYYYPGSGDDCLTRTYIGRDDCPVTYMGNTLYESQTQCEGNIDDDDDDDDDDDNGGGDGSVETITWTEFYSTSSEKFGKKISHCQSTSECSLIDGYDVECVDDDNFLERTYDVAADACDNNLGWLDEILNILGSILPGPAFSCDGIAEGWNNFKDRFTGTKFCVAESNSSYGSIWEGTLKVVGGMGIPAQYVMIVTIFLIIISLGFVINFIK